MNIRRRVHNQHVKRFIQYKQKNWSWEKTIYHRAKHLKVGTIIETCGCDVARVTLIDPESDDCDYVSLTNGGHGSCSIWNCIPTPLRPYAIQSRLDIFKKEGKEGLSLRYYMVDCRMSREAAQKLIDEWRSQ